MVYLPLIYPQNPLQEECCGRWIHLTKTWLCSTRQVSYYMTWCHGKSDWICPSVTADTWWLSRTFYDISLGASWCEEVGQNVQPYNDEQFSSQLIIMWPLSPCRMGLHPPTPHLMLSPTIKRSSQTDAVWIPGRGRPLTSHSLARGAKHTVPLILILQTCFHSFQSDLRDKRLIFSGRGRKRQQSTDYCWIRHLLSLNEVFFINAKVDAVSNSELGIEKTQLCRRATKDCFSSAPGAIHWNLLEHSIRFTLQPIGAYLIDKSYWSVSWTWVKLKNLAET